MEATADFIFYLLDQQKEDNLWEMWLHTSMEKSFKDFKKAQKFQELRKRQKAKPVTPETENKLLAFASQFIKPKAPTGE